MFKATKDNKIIAINETGDFPCLVHDSVEEDTEHTVNDYLQVNGEYVLTSSAEAIEQKKTDVRAIRNQYLEQTYMFIITDYPITSTQKSKYKRYRTYLRDYTLTDNWWENEPLKFEEWSKAQITA